MKKRNPDKTPPVSAEDYGRALRGLGFNLLVTDVPRAVAFATEVLGATSFYDDDDFAALRWSGQESMPPTPIAPMRCPESWRGWRRAAQAWS